MGYSDEVLADGPLAFWKLDEASGTTIGDSSGNGRTGTYTATAVLGEPGLYTGDVAAARASSGMLGSVADGTWMNPVSGLTVEGWVKANNAGDVAALFSRYVSGAGSWIVWQRRGRIGFLLWDGSTQHEIDGPALVSGRTYHVAATVSTTAMVLYVNGRQVARKAITVSLATLQANRNPVQFGAYASANFSLATLSDVALYGSVLSPARILAHYKTVGTKRVDAYTDEVCADSPSAFWALDEASGTSADIVAASTIYASVGTYVGGPTLAASSLLLDGSGTAVTFDGTNDHVDLAGDLIANSIILQGTGQYTAEAIIKTSTSTAGTFLNRTSFSGVNRFQLSVEAGAIKGRNVSTGVTVTSPLATYADNVAHHVALVQDATHLRLYVDGSEVASAASVNTSGSDGQITYIGRGRYAGWEGYFTGTIDEVAVYPAALSSARISAHYDAALGTPAVTIDPGPGSATATGHAPTVAVPVTVSPGPGTALAAGHAPAVSVGGLELSPGAGTALAAGHAPTVDVAASDITITPGPGSAVAGGHAPTVAGADVDITPGPGSAVAGGHAPSVDLDLVADGAWGWVGSVGSARPAPDVVLEPPVTAPAAIEERPFIRVSHRLVLAQDPVTGEYRGDGQHEIVREVVGVPHLWVDGLDVTYFQDRPVKLGDITSAIPGGSRVASVEFPQVSVVEARDIPWLRPWAPAEVSIVRPNGTKIVCFSGHLISEAGGKGKKRNKVEWTLEGDLAAAGHTNLKVPVTLPPVDVGVRIPKLLNEMPGRRFHAVAPFVSGIPTRKRGSYTDKLAGHIQDLLATAWTPAGNQLTIRPSATEPRRPEMAFKDLTPKWTISAPAPGIEVDLMWDWSQVHNAIYGFGSGPDGYGWAGWRFPGFVDYDPPDYPLPAGTSMRVGSSGSGVLTWKTRLIELGWGLSSGSTYMLSDYPTVRAFQTERGILVDGVVGPQTWNEVWNLGPRDLVAPERFPLAVLPAVEPYLYSATGRVLGPNPDHDPTVGRHETDIAYGAGVTFDEAVADAQIRLARESEPGLVGEIKMTSCPWEGSRWEIQEGDALTLLQYRGMDPVLYVSQRKISPSGRDVTLTVDTKARDAMTLVEIIKRERDALADPAGRPGAINRSSRTEQDQVVEFDGESPAGRFPRIAIRQGLWTVWVIPVSQVGRLVEVDFQTDSPIAELSVVLFGKPITANRLETMVGPPLSRDDPFTAAAAELEAAGIIDGWGTKSQPGGHWPGTKDDPTTGRLRVRSSTEYVSQVPPWIWVAVGSTVSTHVRGWVKPPPSMA